MRILELSIAIMAGEQACTYATLILHDDGIAVTVNLPFYLLESSSDLFCSKDFYWFVYLYNNHQIGGEDRGFG